MSEDLMPCPFCGGDARETSYTNNQGVEHRFRVSCSSCGSLRDAFKDTKQQAIKAWNTRTDLAQGQLTERLTCYDKLMKNDQNVN